jgi:mRNA interferase MazF
MNGVVERGELYWIRLGDSVGSEEAVGRPGVVISSKKGNETSNTILIAFTTTQVKYGIINPSTYASGKKTWVLCNQIQTVDKMRLGRYIGKLTDQEMRTVDDALETVLDLGYVDDTALAEKDKEIEKLKAQIIELTGEVAREQAKIIELAAKHEHELLSYKVENAMWQKCYDKALSQLVDIKVSDDLIRRVEQKPVEAPKVPVPVEPNPPAEVVVKDERVDINHCTQTQLKKIGFSDALARAVVAKRPFDSVKDLRNVPGMNAKKYQIFEPKVCCTPVEIIEVDPVVEPEEPVKQETEEKLNINACLGRELHEKTGLALSTAYCITGYRKVNGPYTKLEDILNARQVFPATLDKLRGKIEFGPHVEEKPVVKHEVKAPDLTKYAGNKVNINTATAKEINEKTGLSMTVCYSIVGCRNRDGKYRAVEDLENVPRFTEHHMKYYAPMFEV